jgi:hypothetical protein
VETMVKKMEFMDISGVSIPTGRILKISLLSKDYNPPRFIVISLDGSDDFEIVGRYEYIREVYKLLLEGLNENKQPNLSDYYFVSDNQLPNRKTIIECCDERINELVNHNIKREKEKQNSMR